jgi:hypothetical protein
VLELTALVLGFGALAPGQPFLVFLNGDLVSTDRTRRSADRDVRDQPTPELRNDRPLVFVLVLGLVLAFGIATTKAGRKAARTELDRYRSNSSSKHACP